jgi:chromate transporter
MHEDPAGPPGPPRHPAEARASDRAAGRAGRPRDLVPFRTAVRAWFAISWQTFGGPAGQIAVMQRTLVDDKRWIGQGRFLHALNYCMLLPGPEAQQLAVYTGWLLNGLRGGLVAGIFFVLPGMLCLLALSAVYVAYGDTPLVTGIFAGLAPAVLAIVVQAVARVGKRALTSPALVVLAVAAFVALTLFAVPFPLVILGAGALGWVAHRYVPHLITVRRAATTDGGPAPLIPDDALHAERPSGRRALRVLVIGLLAWTVPVVLVALTTGVGSTLTEQGVFFSGTALVTFGGAYAVLAYVAQRAVETYAWVTPAEMTKGLALAETTPGPLIMVVQFVAFLGAYRNPGDLDPWAAAVLGALLTTWVTFVPSFLFIFLGAPYVEKLRGNEALGAALAAITAAVVGVIANLALYFATHTLFETSTTWTSGPFHLEVPDPSTVQPLAVAIAAVAALLLFAARWSVLRTLGVCAALGLVATALGAAI